MAKLSSNRAGLSKIATMHSPDGAEANTAEDKERFLAGKFHLCTSEDDGDADLDSRATSPPVPGGGYKSLTQWPAITSEEVARRIRKAKHRSAPGPDSISWTHIKILTDLWPGFTSVLAALYNACLMAGHHPSIFKVATIAVLRKPQKPDYSVAGAY